MKQESTLTNWRIIEHDDWCQLCGCVINHPPFNDGERIITSMLERIDFVTGKAETLNTIYNLK